MKGVRSKEGGPSVTPEILAALAPGVEAIVAAPTVEVGEQLLEAAGPQLRVVANFGVGIDNVDLDECRRRDVIVTNTPRRAHGRDGRAGAQPHPRRSPSHE